MQLTESNSHNAIINLPGRVGPSSRRKTMFGRNGRTSRLLSATFYTALSHANYRHLEWPGQSELPPYALFSCWRNRKISPKLKIPAISTKPSDKEDFSVLSRYRRKHIRVINYKFNPSYAYSNELQRLRDRIQIITGSPCIVLNDHRYIKSIKNELLKELNKGFDSMKLLPKKRPDSRKQTLSPYPDSTSPLPVKGMSSALYKSFPRIPTDEISSTAITPSQISEQSSTEPEVDAERPKRKLPNFGKKRAKKQGKIYSIERLSSAMEQVETLYDFASKLLHDKDRISKQLVRIRVR